MPNILKREPFTKTYFNICTPSKLDTGLELLHTNGRHDTLMIVVEPFIRPLAHHCSVHPRKQTDKRTTALIPTLKFVMESKVEEFELKRR